MIPSKKALKLKLKAVKIAPTQTPLFTIYHRRSTSAPKTQLFFIMNSPFFFSLQLFSGSLLLGQVCNSNLAQKRPFQ